MHVIHLIKTFSTLNIPLPKIGVPITTTNNLVWYGMFDGWLNANEVHGHDEINANKVMTV